MGSPIARNVLAGHRLEIDFLGEPEPFEFIADNLI